MSNYRYILKFQIDISSTANPTRYSYTKKLKTKSQFKNFNKMLAGVINVNETNYTVPLEFDDGIVYLPYETLKNNLIKVTLVEYQGN